MGELPKRDITWLVDCTAGRSSGRVCSRFTVETELMEVYQRPDEVVRPSQARRDVSWQERIIQMLDETGLRSDSGQHWNLEGVQSVVDKETNGESHPAIVAVSGLDHPPGGFLFPEWVAFFTGIRTWRTEGGSTCSPPSRRARR